MTKTNMQRFTVYRRNISSKTTHDENQRNADDVPQFEGVIFSDGKVSQRWLTPSGSIANWDKIEDLLKVHAHLGDDYGTHIEWHDAPPPRVWADMRQAHLTSQNNKMKQIYSAHAVNTLVGKIS